MGVGRAGGGRWGGVWGVWERRPGAGSPAAPCVSWRLLASPPQQEESPWASTSGPRGTRPYRARQISSATATEKFAEAARRPER